MDITGNTILITGAGTGIGLEAAKLFDRHGNRVVMVARNEDRLEREAARLKDARAGWSACTRTSTRRSSRKHWIAWRKGASKRPQHLPSSRNQGIEQHTLHTVRSTR